MVTIQIFNMDNLEYVKIYYLLKFDIFVPDNYLLSCLKVHLLNYKEKIKKSIENPFLLFISRSLR